MKAIVKDIFCDEFNLRSYSPDDGRSFSIQLRIKIGLIDSEGADDFELIVCTPKWMVENFYGPKWGRHLLIVPEYDYNCIEKFICSHVGQCTGKDWVEIAAKLARVFFWEFEDYQM